jgi:hypothetical protein
VVDTLMEHLPTAGSSDLARRVDVDQLVLTAATIGSITVVAR